MAAHRLKGNLWRRMVLAAAALPLVGGSAAACRGPGEAGGRSAKVHVGIVFDSAGKNDRSFNAGAWEGGGGRRVGPDRTRDTS
jgi:hypothetical protein